MGQNKAKIRKKIIGFLEALLDLFMSFVTIFWDDITIFWDENLLWFLTEKKKLFWTNKKLVYLIFIPKYHNKRHEQVYSLQPKANLFLNVCYLVSRCVCDRWQLLHDYDGRKKIAKYSYFVNVLQTSKVGFFLQCIGWSFSMFLRKSQWNVETCRNIRLAG